MDKMNKHKEALEKALENFIDFPKEDIEGWIKEGKPITITVLPIHFEQALKALATEEKVSEEEIINNVQYLICSMNGLSEDDSNLNCAKQITNYIQSILQPRETKQEDARWNNFLEENMTESFKDLLVSPRIWKNDFKREIKFRGRRIDNGQWVYGQYFQTPLTDENSGVSSDKGWFFLSDSQQRHCIVQNCVAFVIDINTLGQYIGLKDKNGKEIYEGDICDGHSDGIGIITWTDFDGGYDYIFEDGGNVGIWEVKNYIIVIGNIHENPELLAH